MSFFVLFIDYLLHYGNCFFWVIRFLGSPTFSYIPNFSGLGSYFLVFLAFPRDNSVCVTTGSVYVSGWVSRFRYGKSQRRGWFVIHH